MRDLRLSTRPLSVAAAYRALDRPGMGGVVVFVGRVRPDRVPGGRVTRLDYEVHGPVARAAIERIARDVGPGPVAVVVWHRTGRVRVGGIAVIVGAAAPHRARAFAVARRLIERVKREVPIWKAARSRPGRRRRRPPSPSAGR
ncbi:MAG TPA: molybdenum cofactor biosynthesis protein MoaE [Thermoplasmata archaeon]|nr:molybdenum cofactor biosynthesis protein MoaE [Thermoplasmata archaeon]